MYGQRDGKYSGHLRACLKCQCNAVFASEFPRLTSPVVRFSGSFPYSCQSYNRNYLLIRAYLLDLGLLVLEDVLCFDFFIGLVVGGLDIGSCLL